ncbi:MAG: DUF3791 domain-containing protein [Propionibacteriaceae bacterium]|jgi:hypothetical protein|nr:DUF3791 domain-containing protein [Propionibacteriaceae bacterium]
MSRELDYFIFLIERYGQARGQTGAEVLARLDAAGLTQFVIDMYDLYHVERTENAFADLDDLLANGLPRPA